MINCSTEPRQTQNLFVLRNKETNRNVNDVIYAYSAFSTIRLLPELRQVLLQIAGCIPAFSTKGKGALGPCGPFYQLQYVLAKGRHLLQILLKALCLRPSIDHKKEPFKMQLQKRLHVVCLSKDTTVFNIQNIFRHSHAISFSTENDMNTETCFVN